MPGTQANTVFEIAVQIRLLNTMNIDFQIKKVTAHLAVNEPLQLGNVVADYLADYASNGRVKIPTVR